MRSLSIGWVGAITLLDVAFAVSLLVKSGETQSLAVCTETSTPLQCYTAGLAQIGTARAEMQKVQSDLNAKLSALTDQVAEANRLNRIAAPPGSVLAFDLAGCPEGWSKYDPAVGRFVRGVDPNVGSRRIGSVEDDAFQGHTFGDGATRILRFNPGRTNNDPPNGFSGMQSTGIFTPNGTNPPFGDTKDALIVSNGKDGLPRVADETRPKNVALLYCKRN